MATFTSIISAQLTAAAVTFTTIDAVSDVVGKLCVEKDRPELDQYLQNSGAQLTSNQIVHAPLNVCIDKLTADTPTVQVRCWAAEGPPAAGNAYWLPCAAAGGSGPAAALMVAVSAPSAGGAVRQAGTHLDIQHLRHQQRIRRASAQQHPSSSVWLACRHSTCTSPTRHSLGSGLDFRSAPPCLPGPAVSGPLLDDPQAFAFRADDDLRFLINPTITRMRLDGDFTTLSNNYFTQATARCAPNSWGRGVSVSADLS